MKPDGYIVWLSPQPSEDFMGIEGTSLIAEISKLPIEIVEDAVIVYCGNKILHLVTSDAPLEMRLRGLVEIEYSPVVLAMGLSKHAKVKTMVQKARDLITTPDDEDD